MNMTHPNILQAEAIGMPDADRSGRPHRICPTCGELSILTSCGVCRECRSVPDSTIKGLLDEMEQMKREFRSELRAIADAVKMAEKAFQ